MLLCVQRHRVVRQPCFIGVKSDKLDALLRSRGDMPRPDTFDSIQS